MAKMKGNVETDKMFPFWTQDSKWPGIFEIEWVFIKDVPLREFKSIIITMKDGEVRCVTNSRDCQEIPNKDGLNMAGITEKYFNSNTILEHFEYYDLRQENYEKNNPISYGVGNSNNANN